MKTLIQKVYIENQQSFACREYRTPDFETNWHKHEEYELILITRGNGTVITGDYSGDFREGDVYFLAGNLPHWFRKGHAKMKASAIVLHFRREIFGDVFLSLPEMRNIKRLLGKKNALQLIKELKADMTDILLRFEKINGFTRIQQLQTSLQRISCSGQYHILTSNFSAPQEDINPAIESIFDYSFKNYLQRITLTQIAKVANMSIPTFCRFFKKNIKKTYFEFIQELRIGHACQLLTNGDKPIMEICYESGFNSWAHFSKKFRQIKGCTPSSYRNTFSK